MYFPIKIDLDDLVKEFNLDGSQIQKLGAEILNQITDVYYSSLKQKISSSLKNTARDLYLKGLSIQNLDLLNKEIVLSGWLPNALEEGLSPFDMKTGFSKAKNVKFSKEGKWYMTIKLPFENSEVPKGIKEKISNKPLKENQLPESYTSRKLKETIKGTYQHKSSIFTGIQKNNNKSSTFRRVGEQSEQSSFIHPGFVKRDYFNQALTDIQDEIPSLADKIIDEFLNSQI